MKKTIITMLIVVILLGAVIGLSVATKGFTNWNTKTWVENFKPGDKKPTGDVAGGTLESEKYGKFVIPEQNMFFSLNASSMIGVENNTDFYIFL